MLDAIGCFDDHRSHRTSDQLAFAFNAAVAKANLINGR